MKWKNIMEEKTATKKNMAPIIIAIAVTVIVVAVIVIVVANCKSAKVTRHITAAENYFEEFDYENAVDEYKITIEIDSKNVDAYLGLAETYLSMNEIDSAIFALEEGYRETKSYEIKEMLDELRGKQQTADSGNEVIDKVDDVNSVNISNGIIDEIEKEDVKYTIGDLITFGNDTYSNEWIVLDKDRDRLLLINKNAVVWKEYNDKYTDVTWEMCALRYWLNNEYLNTAFSEEERAAIEYTYVINNDNQDHWIEGGADTYDYIFFLSLDEVNQYFSSDEERLCTYTGEYTGDDGTIHVLENQDSAWWLRTPGYRSTYVAFVDVDGSVISSGIGVTGILSKIVGVRPAMWIDMSATDIYNP